MAIIDLVGKRFGKLVVLERSFYNKRQIVWRCRCDCGQITEVVSTMLCRRDGHETKSCGCLQRERASICNSIIMRKKRKPHEEDMTGQIFGKFVVQERCTGHRFKVVYWKCRCICGKIVVVAASRLRLRRRLHCGCSKRITKRQRNYTNILPAGEAVFNTKYSAYQCNARRKKLVFSLSKKSVCSLFKQRCFYCNIAPQRMYVNKHLNGGITYNGIDRVDNTKGYTEDNVVACCTACNLAKADSTKEEFLAHMERIYQFFVKGHTHECAN